MCCLVAEVRFRPRPVSDSPVDLSSIWPRDVDRIASQEAGLPGIQGDPVDPNGCYSGRREPLSVLQDDLHKS